MASNYNDDEPVTVESGDLGSGKIAVEIFNKADAALEKTDYRLVVELMGSGTGDQRCGVDIVAVLDVSYSMWGKRLEKLKTSMNFLVKKLSPIDRLSVITFSWKAVRLCPLIAMHKNGQAKIEMLINKLEVDSYTNITRGLTEALSVLTQRRQQEGRTSAIMLMADGELTDGFDHPSTVDVSGVPVYTFGLSRDHDSQLLQDIASRSDKGTYSIADVKGSSLNIAFSSCLAGLLSVVVQDLELTITQNESEIQEVHAGSYNQARVNDSVTISFGDLYNREKRSTTVFLSLPPVEERMAMDILKLAFSYRPSGGGALIKSAPITATMTRTSSPVTVDPVEVSSEIARGDIAAAMQMARNQADANDFNGAKKTLENVRKSLDNVNRVADTLIKTLKYEVQEFSRLLMDPKCYLREGRAFALSSELSHNLQRFAARGDASQLFALAIPLVALFANQAIEFEQSTSIKISNKMVRTLTNYDDEPVPVPSAPPKGVGLGQGKIVQNIFNKADASLEKTDYRLVVELMVLDKEEQRCGVDIVVVLDLGGFIHGKKLKKLKTWTNFFVKKLSPIDRLSIVTSHSQRMREGCAH
ncbi:putative E3 ubiquitin-protein ligase EDA40 [Silene latifolia]|uniref:putative E3 ubiquitin-protein ligase EDA40 n=1 Tax=Silene latifolia TaxID=37657 RepID=UPI003D77C7A7